MGKGFKAAGIAQGPWQEREALRCGAKEMERRREMKGEEEVKERKRYRSAGGESEVRR